MYKIFFVIPYDTNTFKEIDINTFKIKDNKLLLVVGNGLTLSRIRGLSTCPEPVPQNFDPFPTCFSRILVFNPIIQPHCLLTTKILLPPLPLHLFLRNTSTTPSPNHFSTYPVQYSVYIFIPSRDNQVLI